MILRSKSPLHRWIEALVLPGFGILCCLLVACPRNQTDKPPDTTDDEEPEIIAPLRETSGLYLLYTVNDPRAAVMNAPEIARVLIACPDGTRREVLFEYPGHIFHIVPSPSGKDVAFVATSRDFPTQEERHLYLYSLADNNYVDISQAGRYSRIVYTAPIFTPDGSSVLFLSKRSWEYPEFMVFSGDVETGAISGLYTDPVEEVPLAMMPDGEHCVAVRRDPLDPGCSEYISLDISTGEATVLHRFENVTKVGPAHFDSDASTIYCDIKPFDPAGSLFGGIRSREALSIDLASGEETNLLGATTVTYIYQIFPDADGDVRLLLRRQEEIEGEDTPMSRIALSNLDGGDFGYLTDTSARCYLLPPPTNIPPLSPDFSLMFFFRQDPQFDHEDIWVMKPDGSDPVNISNTAGYNEGSAGWIVIPE